MNADTHSTTYERTCAPHSRVICTHTCVCMYVCKWWHSSAGVGCSYTHTVVQAHERTKTRGNDWARLCTACVHVCMCICCDDTAQVTAEVGSPAHARTRTHAQNERLGSPSVQSNTDPHPHTHDCKHLTHHTGRLAGSPCRTVRLRSGAPAAELRTPSSSTELRPSPTGLRAPSPAVCPPSTVRPASPIQARQRHRALLASSACPTCVLTHQQPSAALKRVPATPAQST